MKLPIGLLNAEGRIFVAPISDAYIGNIFERLDHHDTLAVIQRWCETVQYLHGDMSRISKFSSKLETIRGNTVYYNTAKYFAAVDISLSAFRPIALMTRSPGENSSIFRLLDTT